jgi:4'-phosphopantetheinyl transferase EntD
MMVHCLFRSRVVACEATPQDVDAQLFPEELTYLERAVAKRRFEFGTARVCARRALAMLGVAPVALVPGPDRAPRWPEGVVGSITHTDDWCAVVVAPATTVRALGIDAETVRPLEPRLARDIVTPREAAFLEQARPHADYDELLILHFSAKEAYYKCQYPLTGEFLGFHDVELEVDLRGGRFVARVIGDRKCLPTEVRELEGRFVISPGRVMSGIEIPVSSNA